MIEKQLAMIAADPKLIGKLCDLIGEMPNIDFPTMGGQVFWDTLAQSNGWKLQKNKFTNHCRIIDPRNIRKAWGSENTMMSALNRLQQANRNYQDDSNPYNTESRKVFCPNCGEKVPEGKFCKECGSRMD